MEGFRALGFRVHGLFLGLGFRALGASGFRVAPGKPMSLI